MHISILHDDVIEVFYTINGNICSALFYKVIIIFSFSFKYNKNKKLCKYYAGLVYVIHDDENVLNYININSKKNNK